MVTKTRRPSINSVAGRFLHWLETRNDADGLKERQDNVKDTLRDWVQGHGEPDDKGSFWYELSEPVSFKDRKGKVHVYTHLKAERHLTPAEPVPDEELAEEFLREHDLWMTEAQEKKLTDLQTRCPNVVIEVRPDLDAVAALYWSGKITEDEYNALLVEQEEVFQFRPQEK